MTNKRVAFFGYFRNARGYKYLQRRGVHLRAHRIWMETHGLFATRAMWYLSIRKWPTPSSLFESFYLFWPSSTRRSIIRNIRGALFRGRTRDSYRSFSVEDESSSGRRRELSQFCSAREEHCCKTTWNVVWHGSHCYAIRSTAHFYYYY